MEAGAVEGDAVEAAGRQPRRAAPRAAAAEAGGEVGDAPDAAVLQEPEVGLAARVAGEDDGAAVEHQRLALIDRRVGEPRAHRRFGIDAE